MEFPPNLLRVVLDPYLLMSLSYNSPVEVFASCIARFAVSDHLSPGDFLPEDYKRIKNAVARGKIELLSVRAVDMADLMPMRNILVLNQVATIATARCHNCIFASDCCVSLRIARKVLQSDRVLCGMELRQRFCHN